jgi:hypothetical protein
MLVQEGLLGDAAMSHVEANIFPIANLRELTTRYRTYRVRGLNRESQDYFKNRDFIIRRLGYSLKAPVEIFEVGDEVFLAVPESATELPDSLMMVRTPVRLDPVSGIHILDYASRSPETDRLCTRFINFMVQGPLWSKLALWQPRTGGGFYEKTPSAVSGGIGRHEGFTVRAVITDDGGIGLCVDVKSCFIDQRPLPARIGRQEFRKLKGRHAIYRFGHQWYDVALFERHDLKVHEYRFPVDGKLVSLPEFIEAQSRKPIPPELANLEPEGAVVMYRNNRNEERAAPAALCYLTHDTESREVRGAHRQTIMPPDMRRAKIEDVCRRYLGDIRIGTAPMRLANRPVTIARDIFPVPDLLFGNGARLSVQGSPASRNVSLQNLGRARAESLTSASAGFFVRSRLDRQYLFLPKTVADSWGSQFSGDLAGAVNTLYPQGGYAPELVVYNDVGIGRTFVEQARAILAAAQASCPLPGFAAVMIHEVQRGRKRAHDQLEAAVLREFPKLSPSLRASVLHSTVGSESYEQVTDASGNPVYRIRNDRRPKFSGYLRNVALSKVLLTNEKWPFVLAEPLHADLTIGIDVKHHTVGYAVVSGAGRSVRFHCEASQQSEKLLSSQLRSQLEAIIRMEFDDHGRSLGSIVIHRDGRAFPEECAGAARAVETLRSEGVPRADATLTIVEISKTGPSTLRFFDVREEGSRPPRILNPQVGLHYITGHDAYLATTGFPFSRPGTSKPLHVRYVLGGLPFKDCIEDIYRLSVLAWGRPDDCSRLPITIKLTDRALGEDATEYDEDALKFGLAPERASA